MMKTCLPLLGFVAFFSLTGVAVTGCGAGDEEDLGEAAESELRALGSDEVVGTIDFGAVAQEVQHPGESSSRRVYRALKVEARAGDRIEARAIVGNAADPVLYVLGSDFRTLKSNDDERAGEKTSFVTYNVKKAGTYYLAFRTKEGWRTKFYLSLRARNGGGPVDPPPPPPPPPSTHVDMFAEPAATPLTPAEVAGLFAPGSTSRALGRYTIVERRRDCTELTGCAGFVSGTTIHGLRGLVSYPTTSWRNLLPGDTVYSGTTSLSTTQNGIQLTLGTKALTSPFYVGACSVPGPADCYAHTNGSHCSLGGTGCHDDEMSVAPLNLTTSVLSFKTEINASYVHGRSVVYRSTSNAQGAYVEAQYAFIAAVNGSVTLEQAGGETMRARVD